MSTFVDVCIRRLDDAGFVVLHAYTYLEQGSPFCFVQAQPVLPGYTRPNPFMNVTCHLSEGSFIAAPT